MIAPGADPPLAALPNATFSLRHAKTPIETPAAMAQLIVDNPAARFAGRPTMTPVVVSAHRPPERI